MWRAPGAGDFRDRITIRRRSSTGDGYGGTVDVWADFLADQPAAIRTVRGGEQVQSERLSGISRADIIIRASTAANTITPADIVVDDRTNATYEIKWVGHLEDGRKRFIVMACTAGEVSRG